MKVVGYRSQNDIDVLFMESGYMKKSSYIAFSRGSIIDDSERFVKELAGEEWRDVVGFEGLYKVSNYGRVLSLRKGEPRLIIPYTTKAGYKRVGIHIRPYQGHYLVHRWVAEAFIPNLNNLPFINHKDENPLNNCVDNLEWCDKQYNNTYGNALQKAHETRVRNGYVKKVYQFDFNGNLINEYSSAYKASLETGICQCLIYACIYGSVSHSAKGYIFLRDPNKITERLQMINKHNRK